MHSLGAHADALRLDIDNEANRQQQVDKWYGDRCVCYYVVIVTVCESADIRQLRIVPYR